MLNINLASDNVAPAAPEVMAALNLANSSATMPYGVDDQSKKLKSIFSELFGAEAWVFPVSTGTAANALALSALTPPYGTIYCTDVAHVQTSEANATELFTGGAKLTLVPSEAGRMTAQMLDKALTDSGKGQQHRSQPAAVTLTIATERGTVYAMNEMARIAEVTKRHGLRLHIDGARLANALVALNASPKSVTTDLGVDALSFGATKNGALNTEAIVVFRESLARDLHFRVRRAGQVWSKMRYSAAQLASIVEDGLWLRLAANANAMALRLARGLERIPGVQLLEPVEINILFADMPERIMSGLAADGIGFGRRDRGVRMVTHWDTTPAQIDHVIGRATAHSHSRASKLDQ